MLVGTVELKISIVDKFLLVPIEPKAYYSPSIMNIMNSCEFNKTVLVMVAEGPL